MLHIIENRRSEKIDNRNIKPITDFFHSCHGNAVISSAYYIIERGLRYSANCRELIYCNIALIAQLNYSVFYSISYLHRFISTLILIYNI